MPRFRPDVGASGTRPLKVADGLLDGGTDLSELAVQPDQGGFGDVFQAVVAKLLDAYGAGAQFLDPPLKFAASQAQGGKAGFGTGLEETAHGNAQECEGTKWVRHDQK